MEGNVIRRRSFSERSLYRLIRFRRQWGVPLPKFKYFESRDTFRFLDLVIIDSENYYMLYTYQSSFYPGLKVSRVVTHSNSSIWQLLTLKIIIICHMLRGQARGVATSEEKEELGIESCPTFTISSKSRITANCIFQLYIRAEFFAYLPVLS